MWRVLMKWLQLVDGPSSKQRRELGSRRLVLLRTGASSFDFLLAFRGDGAKLNQRRGELIEQRLQLVEITGCCS
jgi:hypothetical protein